MEKIISQIIFIGSGIFISLQLLLGGFLIGLIFGSLFAIMRYNNFAIFMIKSFISIMRGTPLILQLSLVYFTVPTLIGIKFNIITTGIIAFGLNSSAYITEILKLGIENLPKGQFEAAKTLHISNFYMWKDIILPQVLKNVFPAIINEVITLLKETALIATIGGMDIMRKAQIVAAEQFVYFTPLCIAGCYYYIFVLLIEYIGNKIEKRGFYGKD